MAIILIRSMAVLLVVAGSVACAEDPANWRGERVAAAANDGCPCELDFGCDKPCRKTCGCGTLLLWCSDPGCTGGADLAAPLIADRPDFTESSVTVGRGVLQ
ncbi:MAG: hypothetical protein WEA31_10940, partial [Pirellulales bacterium]